ncbi:MAG: hypothetical protein CMJ59_05050 [Planctomycetaceae bacterium]|nr:hypothetical protein [Planctomycetaceae bacterium]
MFTSRDPTIVVVDEAGVIRPTGQGETVVRAAGWGNAAEVLVKVGNRTDRPPVSFVNQVMAVLGKAGCNAGSCHGHSKGKGDFKLSLRGYDPSADHRAITDADSGRVVSQRPADSPFLQMPTGQLDHGGGKRFEVNSERYRTLRQWLVEGARSDVGQAVALTRIEVLPESRCVPINAVAPGDIPIDATVGVRTPVQPQQQLIVLAHFADGSVRDVTRQAIYELSDEGVLSVDQRGRVTCVSEGEAAVFVRFLGQMGLARFSILRQKPDFEWREPPSNNYVDEHMATKWKQMQLHPAELSSDAEFLRRVSFDTVGLPPDPSEVRAFLTDPGTDKRKRKIDELLSREGFGDQWALYWAELSGTTESGDSARFKGMWTFSFWLRDTFNRNVPYDQFVRAVVAGKGSSIHNPAMTFITNQLPRVETTAQLFLGIRMRCARCHDHPFDVWKQQDYQALQKFFIRQGYKEGPSDPYGRDIFRFVPPEKHLPWLRDQKITLRLPDASQVEVLGTRDPREIFVEWLFGAAKRRTSRAIVNRVWGRLFGRGIVEPVDDMRFSNPSVNEPLLNALAEDFIENKYDFKYLVRTILHSRTYQLSSRVNESNRNDRANFSHSYLRQLRAEVLLDAIVRVTGRDENFRVAAPGVRAVNLPVTDIQSRFLTLFGRPSERQSACECVRSQTTTLPQVMHLICGETVIEKIRAVDGTLANLLASHPDDGRFIEELYLRVLGRFPQPPERQTAERFLAAADDRTQGGEDMMWALLTSTEFVFNH